MTLQDINDFTMCGLDLVKSVNHIATDGWELSPVDGLWEHKGANPECSLCNGHGVMDISIPFGAFLETCPCVTTKISESYYCHGFGI